MRPAALAFAGIAGDAIARFVLKDEEASATLAAKPAKAPLDFKPLVRAGADLPLAAPSAIDIAVRAAIADHMIETGRDAPLAEALLEVQAERLSYCATAAASKTARLLPCSSVSNAAQASLPVTTVSGGRASPNA